jgi:hypothetical protein
VLENDKSHALYGNVVSFLDDDVRVSFMALPSLEKLYKKIKVQWLKVLRLKQKLFW